MGLKMVEVLSDDKSVDIWTGVNLDHGPVVSHATCVPSNDGVTILLAAASMIKSPEVTVKGTNFKVQAACEDYNLAVLVSGPTDIQAIPLASRKALRFPAPMANGVILDGYKDGRYTVSAGRGYAGGPVLNESGQVVGIWDEREGVIPIAFWRAMSGNLPKKLQDKPYVMQIPEIGCCLQPLSESVQDLFGVKNGNMITFLLPGGAGERAGLRPKDIILGLKINGAKYNMNEDGHFMGVPWTPEPVPLRDLMRWTSNASVSLEIARFGSSSRKNVNVVPDTSMRQGARRSVLNGIEKWETVDFQGMTLAKLRENQGYGEDLHENMYALLLTERHTTQDKVVVMSVAVGSPAEADGVEPGFVLDRVNGKPVGELSMETFGQSGIVELSQLGRHRVFAYRSQD